MVQLDEKSAHIVIWLFHLFDLKLCTVYQFNSKYNGLIIVMHLKYPWIHDTDL